VCIFRSILATSNEVNRWFIAVYLRYLPTYTFTCVIGIYDILFYIYMERYSSSLNTDNAILYMLYTCRACRRDNAKCMGNCYRVRLGLRAQSKVQGVQDKPGQGCE